MEITTRNLIDIERYTNDIRGSLLELLFGGTDIPNEDRDGYASVAHAFDRATTTALFKHLTADQSSPAPETLHGPLKAASSRKASGPGKGGPKPGSAAAKARAAKASATRAANKAAKEAAGDGNGAAPVGSAARPATGFGGMPQGSGGAV